MVDGTATRPQQSPRPPCRVLCGMRGSHSFPGTRTYPSPRPQGAVKTEAKKRVCCGVWSSRGPEGDTSGMVPAWSSGRATCRAESGGRSTPVLTLA